MGSHWSSYPAGDDEHDEQEGEEETAIRAARGEEARIITKRDDDDDGDRRCGDKEKDEDARERTETAPVSSSFLSREEEGGSAAENDDDSDGGGYVGETNDKDGGDDNRQHHRGSSRKNTTARQQQQYDNSYQDPGIKTLVPPLSRSERLRDAVMRLLDHKFFQKLGLLVLFLVVADGALFFFFLMGWQNLCDAPSKTDCEPRNAVYNASIQVLTALFTYMATFSLPWRCANAAHVFGGTLGGHLTMNRRNDPGYDLYGLPTNDVWYYMPLSDRRWVVSFLLLNCITQFFNQVTRILFSTCKYSIRTNTVTV